MIYADGTTVHDGDIVKLANDERFSGSYESGYMLALCRYGYVLNTWPNNNQISVRFNRMQDTEYAIRHPENVSASIFEHDVYSLPEHMTFVERGERFEV